MDVLDKYRGCLTGLVIGELLGSRPEIREASDFAAAAAETLQNRKGKFGVSSSLALSLADSLLENYDFSPRDQMARYLKWVRENDDGFSKSGAGISETMLAALKLHEETNEPYCGKVHPNSCESEPLTRLAPVPLLYREQPEHAIYFSGESARTTHGSALEIETSRYFGTLLLGAVEGRTKEELLDPTFPLKFDYWNRHLLDYEIIKSAGVSLKENALINESPHVIHRVLRASLRSLAQGDNFMEGLWLVLGASNVARRCGPVFGQLAGAYYGMSGIPETWRLPLEYQYPIDRYSALLVNASCGRSEQVYLLHNGLIEQVLRFDDRLGINRAQWQLESICPSCGKEQNFITKEDPIYDNFSRVPGKCINCGRELISPLHYFYAIKLLEKEVFSDESGQDFNIIWSQQKWCCYCKKAFIVNYLSLPSLEEIKFWFRKSPLCDNCKKRLSFEWGSCYTALAEAQG